MGAFQYLHNVFALHAKNYFMRRNSFAKSRIPTSAMGAIMSAASARIGQFENILGQTSENGFTQWAWLLHQSFYRKRFNRAAVVPWTAYRGQLCRRYQEKKLRLLPNKRPFRIENIQISTPFVELKMGISIAESVIEMHAKCLQSCWIVPVCKWNVLSINPLRTRSEWLNESS